MVAAVPRNALSRPHAGPRHDLQESGRRTNRRKRALQAHSDPTSRRVPSVVDSKLRPFSWHPRRETSNPQAREIQISCKCGLKSAIRSLNRRAQIRTPAYPHSDCRIARPPYAMLKSAKDWRAIMEQRKVSVDDWIARQQDGRRLAAEGARRQAIRQWVTVTVVVSIIAVVMVAFGGS
jgi:hypothetical protein